MKKRIIDFTIKEMFDICKKACEKACGKCGCYFCPIYETEMLCGKTYCIPGFYDEKDLSIFVDVDDFSER